LTIVRGSPRRMARGTDRLLHDVPSFILDSYPVTQWGLTEGLALAVSAWRAHIAAGEIPASDMRASLIPVAGLASAMLESLLRGVPINQRAAEFELLADESNRLLTGRPHAVIIQSGIS
jgi:hypothetical protein